MAVREYDERIDKLKEEGYQIYSISKINTIEQCLRQAYYTYKTDLKGMDSIYGMLGTRIHEVLEHIFNEEATEDDLLPALKDELAITDSLGITFPKDFKGGDSIRESWINDMTAFCKSYEKPDGKFETEKPILFQIGERRYLRGFIDLIEYVDDKHINIYDFKTSSEFKKSDLIHHGRQLVCYKMALEKEYGDDIEFHVYWNMLKYVKVSFIGYKRFNSKTKTPIEKVIHRGKLASELEKYFISDMEESGYSDIEIELAINSCKRLNSLRYLPAEIQERYTIEPYILEYEITPEIEDETVEYITKYADIFESKGDNIKEWPAVEIDKGNNFFCNTLCDYRKICPDIQKYNALRELDNIDFDDLF